MSEPYRTPKPWHAELARKIEQAKRDYAERDKAEGWVQVGESNAPAVRPVAEILVEIGPILGEEAVRRTIMMTGLVNAAEFCGADPETLLLNSANFTPDANGRQWATLYFTLGLAPGVTWNLFPDPDGNWRELATTNQPYPPADFAAI